MAWAWAFLEAIVLPLPPEILLIPLAVAHPERTLGLVGSAVAGSLTGGCVSYVLGWRYGGQAIAHVKRLPGVNADQVLWASSMLKQFGSRFVAVSPWLVLPYKITSVLSGHLRLRWWRYLAAGAIGRGTRLIGIVGSVSLIAAHCQPFIDSHPLTAILFAYAAVAAFVWMVRRAVLVGVCS